MSLGDRNLAIATLRRSREQKLGGGPRADDGISNLSNGRREGEEGDAAAVRGTDNSFRGGRGGGGRRARA